MLRVSSKPIQNLCFGGCWEEQVCSQFPSFFLSCFNLSGAFSVIQPSLVVASASSLFSNIFTEFQSHSNLFRHIVGSFPEDYICGRLEILFTPSYFCVAISVCKYLRENILCAQTQASENSKETKKSVWDFAGLEGEEWIIRLENKCWGSKYIYFLRKP